MRHGTRGQVLVETAIVMPVMIFVVLGALQVMLLQHARVMAEYAAFSAARAGIVHNANWNVMRNAALVAALPIYGRTDTLTHFGAMWGKVKVLAEATELVDTAAATLEAAASDLLDIDAIGFLPDLSLVEVEVTSPVEADFERAFDAQVDAGEGIDALNYPDKEIDFDARATIASDPRLARLAVETRVLAPLKVPLVNWIIFQLWYAKQELNLAVLRSSLPEWSRFESRVAEGAHAGERLEDVVRNTEGQQAWDNFLLTSQRTKEARLLRDLALARGVYLIPLRASYAMQMQSNPFFENRRQPVWFSFAD